MRYSSRPHAEAWRGPSSRGLRLRTKFRGVKPVALARLVQLIDEANRRPKPPAPMKGTGR